MKGLLFLLFLLCVVLCCAAGAFAAGPSEIATTEGLCVLAIPVTAEVVTPPIAVRVVSPPYGVVAKVLRGTSVFIGRRTYDVRIDTRRAAVRVHVAR
jgi:hypothetical protein